MKRRAPKCPKAPKGQPPAGGGTLDATLDGELLQTIEGKAALLAFAVAGIGPGDDATAIEPIATFAQQLHSDILDLMEITGVGV